MELNVSFRESNEGFAIAMQANETSFDARFQESSNKFCSGLTEQDAVFYSGFGEKVVVVVNGGSGESLKTDETLHFDENGVLGVNTTDEAEADNTLPITSAGVHTQLGNIEILLGTI